MLQDSFDNEGDAVKYAETEWAQNTEFSCVVSTSSKTSENPRNTVMLQMPSYIAQLISAIVFITLTVLLYGLRKYEIWNTKRRLKRHKQNRLQQKEISNKNKMEEQMKRIQVVQKDVRPNNEAQTDAAGDPISSITTRRN